MKLFARRRQEAADRERIAIALEEIVVNLRSMSAYLSLYTRLIQEEKTSPKPAALPQSIVDAAELFARKLWLELPEESKRDLWGKTQ